MAKKTWVKIEGVWKEMENVWINVGGSWKQRIIPKGNIDGIWKEFIQYFKLIYKNGVVYEPLEKAFGMNFTMEYKTDHIFINGNLTNNGLWTINLVDVTEYTKVYIEWEFTTTNQANSCQFQIRKSKSSGSGTVNFVKVGNLQRQITELDVTSLSGEYYPYFGYRHDYSAASSMKIYRVWFE